MKLKLFILFYLFTSNFYSQENKNIDYVIFKYDISVVAFSEVKVSIFENISYNKKEYILEAEFYENFKKRKKKINLTEEEFIKIVEAICKINNTDLIENFSSGLDGSNTSLEFGNSIFNTIKFELWSVHKSQTNTNLKNFIESIQLILKIADIKIEDYN